MQYKGYKIKVFVDDKMYTRYALLNAETPIEQHWYVKDLLHKIRKQYPNAKIEVVFEPEEFEGIKTVSENAINESSADSSDENENIEGLEFDFNSKS